MEEKKRKTMPKNPEDYKINYNFSNDSRKDINQIMKECFLLKLNCLKK